MMSSRTSERNKSSGLLSDWQPARKSQRDVFQTLRMNRTQWKMPPTRYRNPSPGTAWRAAPYGGAFILFAFNEIVSS
jgi:hypothetical protein